MTRDTSNNQTAQFYSEENKVNFPMLVRYETGETSIIENTQDIRFGISFTVLKSGNEFRGGGIS